MPGPLLPTVLAMTLALAPRAAPGHKTCGLGTIPQRYTTTPTTSLAPASLSSDGRFLAFASQARLLSVDTNGRSDIYVLDRSTGQLTIETLMPDGRASAGDSLSPRISDDGRLLVFDSLEMFAPWIVRNGVIHVFLRDRWLETTTLLSISRSGAIGNGHSTNPVISANGRVVAFESGATNLLPGADANGAEHDVYFVDLATRDIARASVDSAGTQPVEGGSFSPRISADGRHVVFTSKAVLSGDDHAAPTAAVIQAVPVRRASRRPAQANVFVHDLERRITSRVSRRADGSEPNGASYAPAVSGDGRSVAFVSEATDLVAGDKNGAPDIYLHDLDTSMTSLVSRSAAGGAANGGSTYPAISGTGRVIAFQSEASNLVCSKRCAPADRDINMMGDVFMHDRTTGLTTRVSADPESGWMEPSGAPALDATGDVLSFSSRRPLDEQDRGNDFDLFVRTGCAGDRTMSQNSEASRPVKR
jgi:Tol biopolymer transport system component